MTLSRMGSTRARTSRPRLAAIVPLLLLVAVGCAGEAPDAAGQFDTLDVANAAALPSIPQELWAAAPAGCEGRVVEAGDFGVAEGEPELVVAFDRTGAILCADTYPALESELVDSGLGDEVDRLWLGYLATLQDPELSGSDRRQALEGSWDPVPQTNYVADQDGIDAMEDPSPQTNDDSDILPDVPPDTAVPDPVPQPNSGPNSGPNGTGANDGSMDDASLAPVAHPTDGI